MWRTPTDESAGREVAPLGLGRLREACAQPRAARVDPDVASGLGVDQPELAGVDELLLARVADLDRDHLVPRGELEHRRVPVARPAEVGDDHHERALACDRGRATDGLAERGRADATPDARCSSRSVARRPSKPSRPCRTGSHRSAPSPKVITPSRFPRRVDRWPKRDRHALGEVGLPAVGGAEEHRRRRVEHEPGDEHPLGELDAHVRLAGPRGDRPVDHPDVVARHVPPDHRQLGAVPEQRRAVVAREEALARAARS